MTAAERISNALRTGESNAVSLADMCIISGLNNRHTRLVIEDMRRKGAVICSSECGYFYPADRSELSRYVNRGAFKSKLYFSDVTLCGKTS